MGILNVTPDSFSDGGSWTDPSAAVVHAQQLVADGADIIDIGGESTRPGAEPVSAEEELRRTIPVIQELARRIDVPISIDTTKAVVAEQALAAGAEIVNDVSALTLDPAMVDVCRNHPCGVIVMHMLGTPQTMQEDPRYENVLTEVRDYLTQRVAALDAAGIAADRIVIDPGIGFGKTAQHNLDLLAHVDKLRNGGRPVLIGHSRKRFLGKLVGRKVEERLAGTVGVSIALAEAHADFLRVHDVAAVRDAITAWSQIRAAATGQGPSLDDG